MKGIGFGKRLTALAAAVLLAATVESAHAEEIPLEQATMLSAFGERAAFSPNGTRIAFVGKSYGDAYEIELATGHVRNLTSRGFCASSTCQTATI